MKRQKLLTALAELWDWNSPEIGDLFPSDSNTENEAAKAPVYVDVTQELAFFHFGLETMDLLIAQDDDEFEDDFEEDDDYEEDMDFDDDDFDDEDDLDWDSVDDDEDFDMDDFDLDDDEFDEEDEVFDDED